MIAAALLAPAGHSVAADDSGPDGTSVRFVEAADNSPIPPPPRPIDAPPPAPARPAAPGQPDFVPAAPNQQPASVMAPSAAAPATSVCCPQGHDMFEHHHCPVPFPGWHDCYFTEPFGCCVRSNLGAQVTNGLVGQSILYRYDFYDGLANADGMRNDPSQLNPHGVQQLRKIASWWGLLPTLEIVVQPSGSARLDQARRQAVAQRMSDMTGGVIPLSAVVVDVPDVRGTDGTEAVIERENLLREAQQASQPLLNTGTYGGNNNFQLGSQQSNSGQ